MYNEDIFYSAIHKAGPKPNPIIVNALVDHVDILIEDYQINTNPRILHFLAQMAHESASFRALVEYRSDNSSEKKYGVGTRVGKILGNTHKGDGAKYKGRGIIQLTGRYNYGHYGKLIGEDLINSPEKASEPLYAVKIAGAYWNSKNLNKYADRGDIRGITKRINGGYNGLSDRIRRFNKIKNLKVFS